MSEIVGGIPLAELVAVGSTVAAVMVPLGSIIIWFARRNIDAVAEDLGDKEKRLRALESTSHVIDMVNDHEARLRSAEGKLSETASRKDVEDARIAIQGSIAGLQVTYERRIEALQTVITDAIVNRDAVEPGKKRNARR